jgi:hypothetical protein
MSPDFGTIYATMLEPFSQVGNALTLLLTYSPYWGPFILALVFWRAWLKYIRMRYIADQEYVLLELRLPHEVMKSPVAMQAVLESLWQRGGEATFIDRLWKGKVRLWYSFELVSLEGQVHLYIWGRKAMRRTVERTLYAHYPDVEVVEAEDYALALPFSLERHNLYGLDYKLDGPIGLPIKTYEDYHLDQTSTKEEQKIDPIAHVLEYCGSMGKGEYVWIQILARASKKEDLTYGPIRNYASYSELAQMEVARIRNNPEQVVVFPDGGSGKVLSDGQMQRIKSINRVAGTSRAWDIGIRGIYIAEHEHFDGTNIPALIGVWQAFGAPGYNSITIDGSRWQPIFDYPWQDFNGYRENKKKVEIIDAYRRRSWFHPPYEFHNFMMTSEELATLFHLPGTVAQTPTIQRVTSTRAQAPANLPV